MATLRSICWRTQGAYFAIENSDGQWARLSYRALAQALRFAQELQDSGKTTKPNVNLVSDIPWFDTEGKWTAGIDIDGEQGNWVAIYMHSGQPFCTLSDADVLAIEFTDRHAHGKA